jgi:hypothetical protein
VEARRCFLFALFWCNPRQVAGRDFQLKRDFQQRRIQSYSPLAQLPCAYSRSILFTAWGRECSSLVCRLAAQLFENQMEVLSCCSHACPAFVDLLRLFFLP